MAWKFKYCLLANFAVLICTNSVGVPLLQAFADLIMPHIPYSGAFILNIWLQIGTIVYHIAAHEIGKLTCSGLWRVLIF